MLTKFKTVIILAAFVALCACGYDYDWMSGEFEGTTKITSVEGSEISNETVSTGNGRINFKIPFYARLGSNTSVPDCNLHFNSETEPYKYRLVERNSAYQGESNDGKGCKAFLTTGVATDIEFYQGKMRRETDGEVIMTLRFQVKGATGTSGQYEFEFRGRKKGWF